MKPLRKCTRCGKEAHTIDELSLFEKQKTGLHGHRNRCLECNNILAKEHYHANPDYYKAQRLARKDWIHEYNHRYYQEHISYFRDYEADPIRVAKKRMLDKRYNQQRKAERHRQVFKSRSRSPYRSSW